jgi:hypothetical protein
MTRSTPSWGKALGIIMICLGGLGILMQIYKMMFPMMFKLMRSMPIPPAPINNELAPQKMLDFMFGQQNSFDWLILIGVIGIFMVTIYIIGGVKLLTTKPINYHFAKWTLIAMLLYNGISLILFWTTMTGFFIRIFSIYIIVGFVFDLAILIILLSSNKAAYGIGNQEALETYSYNQENEEVI